MSYDTTVHDALEPPLPRVAEARTARRMLAVRWFVQRRLVALASVAAISLSTLGGVTWTVARLSGPTPSTLAEETDAAPLSLPRSSSNAIAGGQRPAP